MSMWGDLHIRSESMAGIGIVIMVFVFLVYLVLSDIVKDTNIMDYRIIRDVCYGIVYVPQVKKSFLGFHYWIGITDKGPSFHRNIQFGSLEEAKMFLAEYSKGKVVED